MAHKFVCIEMCSKRLMVSHMPSSNFLESIGSESIRSLNEKMHASNNPATDAILKYPKNRAHYINWIKIHDSLVERIRKVWMNWSQSKSLWKKKTVGWGNALFEKIPYEEHLLKSIPLASRRLEILPQILLIHGKSVPPSLILQHLQKATDARSIHWKRFWYSIAALPLTFPLILVPLVPNLPGFYLAFRAWSNWRSTKGAESLLRIIQSNSVNFCELAEIDRITETARLRCDSLEASPRVSIQSRATVPAHQKSTMEEQHYGLLHNCLDEQALDDLSKMLVSPQLRIDGHRLMRLLKKESEVANK